MTVIPNFRIETHTTDANTDESLLEMLLEEQGVETTEAENLSAVEEMFNYAAPEGKDIKSMLFTPPKKNGKPTYH